MLFLETRPQVSEKSEKLSTRRAAQVERTAFTGKKILDAAEVRW
jgi:hypothetical protein